MLSHFIAILFALTPALTLAEEAVWQYSVRPGDTLIALGKQHLINPDDWKTIQQLNQVKNPFQLQAGRVINIPLALVKSGPAYAEVLFVSGDVTWQQSASQFKPIESGQKLGPGARITTKANSKVVIQFADLSKTVINSNSVLVLDALSLYSGGAMVDTKLRLQQGSVETEANPKHIKGNGMEIITPSAVAAVRGTRFRVDVGGEDTTQGTLEGQVAVRATSQVVTVNQGYGTRAQKGKPPVKPVTLLPAADTSQLPKHFESLPISFTLPTVNGAKAWAATVATDADFNQINAEKVTQSQQLVFNHLPDGKLFLSLKAKDHQGIAGYTAKHTFVLNAQPFQPSYLKPANGVVLRKAKPTLHWQPVSAAESYWVEIATDAEFNNIYKSERTTANSYQFLQPLNPGQYFWRVRSIATLENGDEDIGPALSFRQFGFKAPPPKPDVSQLQVKVTANHAYITTLEPPQNLRYEVRLANMFNQQDNVWQANKVGGSFDFLLKEYGKQTLYIRHIDADGFVGPEAIVEFDASPEKDWFVY